MRMLYLVFTATTWLCGVCNPSYAATTAATIAATNLSYVPAVFENIGLLKPYGVQVIGQSFTSERSGLLASLDTYVAAGWDSPTTQPLEVTLFSSFDGLPVGYIGGQTFSATNFNRGGADFRHLLFESLDMSQSNIRLIRGEDYIVVFDTFPGVESAQSAYAPYHIGAYVESTVAAGPLGTNFSRARDGVTWEILPVTYQWELALSVYVVPELTTTQLAISVTLAALAIRVPRLSVKRRAICRFNTGRSRLLPRQRTQ